MRLPVELAFLGAMAVLVAAQVPHKALKFRPRQSPAMVPGASFVELDDTVYTRLCRRALASDSGRSRWYAGVTDREIGAFALEEPLLPPAPIIGNEGFGRVGIPVFAAPAIPREPILPATMAAPRSSPLPPVLSHPDDTRQSTDDLLDLNSYVSLSAID